jgi:hypothetical protein
VAPNTSIATSNASGCANAAIITRASSMAMRATVTATTHPPDHDMTPAPNREQQILRLRFYGNLTRTEIVLADSSTCCPGWG